MSPTPRARSETAAQRTARRLGQMMSMSMVLLFAGDSVLVYLQNPGYALWWNLAGAVLPVIVLLVATLAAVLPYRILLACWIAAPVLACLLWLTAFLAYGGEDPDATLPWVWTFAPIAMSYLVLWTRPRVAISATVLGGCLPAVSALLFLGHVPHLIAALTPVYITNIGFVAFFYVLRERLGQATLAERRAYQQRRLHASAAGEARRQEQLARLIHDEVLSVLSAAMNFHGAVPPQLRASAEHALLLLDAPTARTGRARESHEALASITAALRRIDPLCPLYTEVDPGIVPTDAVEAVTAASAEALRNSVRHAGECARRLTVHVAPGAISAVIADDGRGFEPQRIDPARLGVRESILGRMRSLPGGAAQLRTAPGEGTEVTLTWRR